MGTFLGQHAPVEKTGDHTLIPHRQQPCLRSGGNRAKGKNEHSGIFPIKTLKGILGIICLLLPPLWRFQGLSKAMQLPILFFCHPIPTNMAKELILDLVFGSRLKEETRTQRTRT